MFAFHRSAFAVLAPLALLLVVVAWSSRSTPAPAVQQARVSPEQINQEHVRGADRAPHAGRESQPQTVAANLSSR